MVRAFSALTCWDQPWTPKQYSAPLRSIRSKGNVDPDWAPQEPKYEYKWDVPEAQTQTDVQVFGPYTSQELHAWFDARYFGEAGEKVKVREVGGEWGDWDDVME